MISILDRSFYNIHMKLRSKISFEVQWKRKETPAREVGTTVSEKEIDSMKVTYG